MQNENESQTNTPHRQFKSNKQTPSTLNNPDVKRVKYQDQTTSELQSSPPTED